MFNLNKIPYDATGKRLPIGKSLLVEYDWQVGDGSNAPAWATIVGTPTYSTLAGNPAGLCTLTTTAVSGNAVSVKLANDIETANVQSIEILLDGLRFDIDSTTKYDFTLAGHNHTASRGMYIRQKNGNTRMDYYMYNAGAPGPASGLIPYALAGENKGDRAKSVGMLIVPRLFGCYLLADDQAVWKFSSRNNWVNGPIFPGFEFITREAVAHSVSFSRMRIRVYD